MAEEKFEAFNADGDPIEGILPPEEIKTLQSQLEETKTKLSKLENKDFNFRKLEQMTEEEKGKLTATELSLKQQAEELENRQKSFQENFVKDVKNDLLTSMVGDDKDLREKIELNYNRIKDADKAQSRDEINALLRDAYAMSVGTKFRNPVVSANNASGNPVVKSEKASGDFVDFAKKFGLSEEDINK